MNRLITADASKVSGAEFFAAVTGHAPRTKEQQAAEWRAMCERYADFIENDGEWAVPPPCLADARKIVAERQQLVEVERGRAPDNGNERVAA